MKKIRLLCCFITIALILVTSCHKKVLLGSVYIIVKHNSQGVSNAQITTDPITQLATTDLTGDVIMSDIPVGTYKISAYHPSIGTGSTLVTITEDETTAVTISLIDGLFEHPIVKIQSPSDSSMHDIDKVINFSAKISDTKDTPQSLDLEWVSNIDGILNTDVASADSITSFSISTLSPGDHTITLNVTDSEGWESTGRVHILLAQIPNPVVLAPITISNNSLILNWTASSDAIFANYCIFKRASPNEFFSKIATITDSNITTFEDTEVVADMRYRYKIRVTSNDGGQSSDSNVQAKIFELESMELLPTAKLIHMIQDPERAYLYALNETDGKLFIINKTTKVIEKSLDVGDNPSDIDLNIENTKAYIANFGNTQITVVDLEMQETENVFVLETPETEDWYNIPYRLVCLADNKLAYTGKEGSSLLTMIDATTGTLINTTSLLNEAGLQTNSTNTTIFATESGFAFSSILQYDLSGDELVYANSSNWESYLGSRDGCISGNDAYVFHRRKKFPVNNLLSTLGTFDEDILTANHDGSIAIGHTYIWDATNFTKIESLPVYASLVVLDTDDNTIYIYNEDTISCSNNTYYKNENV